MWKTISLCLVYPYVGGYLPLPASAPRAFPSALSPYHPQHSLEWIRHQRRGSRTGETDQYWSHAAEVTATLGRTRLQDGRPSLAQDCSVWRTLLWPSQHRGSEEAVQRHSQKGSWCLRHWPSPVDDTRCRPWHMASNHPPGRVLCRRKPHGQPQGETAQEEDTCGFGFNPRPDLHLQPLQPDMFLPHRLYQPRACLQATWTTPFLIFVREATPWWWCRHIVAVVQMERVLW